MGEMRTGARGGFPGKAESLHAAANRFHHIMTDRWFLLYRRRQPAV